MNMKRSPAGVLKPPATAMYSPATRHDRQDGGMLVRQEINLNAERRRPEALTGGRGRRKIFRERGWWQSGLDKLASYRPLNKLEGWVSIGQTLDAKLLSALTVALQSTAPNHPLFSRTRPWLDSSGTVRKWDYWVSTPPPTTSTLHMGHSKGGE